MLAEAARYSLEDVREVDSGRSANRNGDWFNEVKATFNRYIGIDYSGAETCDSSLKGLRVYVADPLNEANEVAPPPSLRKYWTRKAIAEWLAERLSEGKKTLVGIEHGFSFPLQYFEQHGLPHEWSPFLDDFHRQELPATQRKLSLACRPCAYPG